MNKKGFTLIELILVITILGILAVSALPRFLNLSTNAKQAARDGVVGAVRSGIALYRANDMVTNGGAGVYPTALDTAGTTGNCTAVANGCFAGILISGVNDASWSKTSDTVYVHNDGTTAKTYTYNTTDGTFQ